MSSLNCSTDEINDSLKSSESRHFIEFCLDNEPYFSVELLVKVLNIINKSYLRFSVNFD